MNFHVHRWRSSGEDLVCEHGAREARLRRPLRLLVLGCAAIAVVLGILVSACGSVPVVRDVPKPARLVVERAACDEAARQIPDASARAVFLASCYEAADVWGAHHVDLDAGAE